MESTRTSFKALRPLLMSSTVGWTRAYVVILASHCFATRLPVSEGLDKTRFRFIAFNSEYFWTPLEISLRQYHALLLTTLTEYLGRVRWFNWLPCVALFSSEAKLDWIASLVADPPVLTQKLCKIKPLAIPLFTWSYLLIQSCDLEVFKDLDWT